MIGLVHEASDYVSFGGVSPAYTQKVLKKPLVNVCWEWLPPDPSLPGLEFRAMLLKNTRSKLFRFDKALKGVNIYTNGVREVE